MPPKGKKRTAKAEPKDSKTENGKKADEKKDAEKKEEKIEIDEKETPSDDDKKEEKAKAEQKEAPAKKRGGWGWPKRKAEAGDGSGEPKEKQRAKNSIVDCLVGLDYSTTAKAPNGKEANFKIASWNLNGLRAWLEKDGLDYVKAEQPDVFCVQETKCDISKIPEDAKLEGYTNHWLSGDKDGYSGVGMYFKTKPLSVTEGIGIEKHDKEGRVITAEFEKFYLVNTYIPNSSRGLVRLNYRTEEWDVDFRNYLKTLDKKKPVVWCGDLNVAHQEIDIKNPKGNVRNAGFTDEERNSFTETLKEGFIDSFRHLHPKEEHAYTFWTYMMNARAKNAGWRLDYFVLSERFKENLCDSVIRSKVMGSDHCPIVLHLAL
ncbi:unnamed protein product [Lymnaea stagnalis]|uniref:DNA-(apurinic or apyrimidinic site) endonuclease n=1 Tax=Lymnaea stagnalis TaxID=6523 RepID=A0AAV2H5R2_LYMST